MKQGYRDAYNELLLLIYSTFGRQCLFYKGKTVSQVCLSLLGCTTTLTLTFVGLDYAAKMQRYVIAMKHQKQPTEVNDALDSLSFYLANPLFCFFCHLFNYEANENRGVFFHHQLYERDKRPRQKYFVGQGCFQSC